MQTGRKARKARKDKPKQIFRVKISWRLLGNQRGGVVKGRLGRESEPVYRISVPCVVEPWSLQGAKL